MNLTAILAELKAEHAALGEVIVAMERLAVGSGTPRRGRPPKWLASARVPESKESTPATSKKRGRHKKTKTTA